MLEEKKEPPINSTSCVPVISNGGFLFEAKPLKIKSWLSSLVELNRIELPLRKPRKLMILFTLASIILVQIVQVLY